MDLVKQELEILEFWERNKIFEKSVAQRKRGRHFVFYDGPPFATGLPHHGHILASVIKDAVPRFHAMRGKYIERRWGWDCHGLPLENLVEQELGLKTKKDIEHYGIDRFNAYAKESVLRYADDWKKIIPRIARWVDMEHDYKTMDWTYMETIWWIFKNLYDRKLIYEGYKSMHICPRCETTLANFEVSQGYKDVTDLSVYVKFELVDEPGTYVLAWTTTPWTLPGNVALAVDPNIQYVKVRTSKGLVVILAKTLYEYIAALEGYHPLKGQLGFFASREATPLPVIEAVLNGSQLIRRNYNPLFNYYYNDPKLKNRENGWKIYPADFVTTDEGTGVVHIAPAFGEEDMELGKKFDLPFVQHIEMNGTFKPEVKDFAGLPAKSKADPQATDKKIIALLRERGALFTEQPFPHSYPHCWRCETPLLNYAASSWFVNVQQIKKKLIAQNKKVSWTPAHIRDGRFGKALEGAPDWAISRSRYWGAPLPVWQCEACARVEVIGSLDELKKRQGKDATLPMNDKGEVDLHRPYIDRISFPCPCGGVMRRIPEVFDCWFESGSMPYGQWHYPFENQKKFDPKKGIGFPADFIDEGLDQTRGWFYSLLVLATALYGKAPYRHVNAHGTILAEDGQKMSKRLKNYPDPMEVVAKYGADALRLYLLSQPVVQGEDLNFSLKAVDEVYKKYSLIAANTLNFYLLYKDQKLIPLKAKSYQLKAHILDRWILSRLHHAIKQGTDAFESYELIAATRVLTEFVEDLSLWYVRRSRERVKSPGPEAEAALSTLRLVLFDLARLMAPVTPFLAETVHQSLRSRSKISVHLEDWPEADKRFMNKRLESDMKTVREIASQALRLRAEAGIKVRQPLGLLRIRNQEVGIRKNKELLKILADEINVKEIAFDPKIDQDLVLDPTITPQLREEGIVRELTRALQDIRKKHGLTPDRRVTLHVAGLTKEFLAKWQDRIEGETKSRLVSGSAQGGEPIMLEGMELIVRLVSR